MTDRELMQQSLDALEGNDLGLHYRTIDALRAALAQTAPAVPAVQIGMKASTWETLSSDAQTLILEAGQRAVDKAKAQRLADAAARGGMAQIPLDGSAAAPAVREPLEGAVDPDCNYIAPMGKVCNKCGRIHRGITGDGK